MWCSGMAADPLAGATWSWPIPSCRGVTGGVERFAAGGVVLVAVARSSGSKSSRKARPTAGMGDVGADGFAGWSGGTSSDVETHAPSKADAIPSTAQGARRRGDQKCELAMLTC